ncbi:hypothetical protein [Nocardia thailandica]|nr:hypothetical protein [Nocardia thailandica]
MTEQAFIAALFVTGPIAMVIWSEAAVLHGRGPTARELLGRTRPERTEIP